VPFERERNRSPRPLFATAALHSDGRMANDMKLDMLLGDVPLQHFVAEYFQRLPYSAAGLAQPLCELGSWETLTSILAREQADVLVCRRNEQHPGPRPTTDEAARRLVDEGYTLLVRHAERHDERLGHLAAAFQRDFAATVNIHFYCTPAGQFGFGWHYDAEEVFIVQTTGRKEYSLRKNTVNPWPIEETLPADMRYEREIMPLVRCELAAGDWLYIPSGYWHMATAGEMALSLAIGVQPRTGIDLFDFFRSRVVESLFWRQRLPVAGAAAALSEDELRAAYTELLQQFGREFAKLATDSRVVESFLAELRASPGGGIGGPSD
jgi:50S ribosomal protein L16 3-hydroxylase